jgi:peptide deformylase
MARIIVQHDDAVLRDVAKEIPKEDIGSPAICALIKDMKALLAKEKYGVALAAPQVGESVRLFIVAGSAIARRKKASKKDDDADDEPADALIPPVDQVYINPELVKLSRGRKKKHEGCLSVRGKWGMVPRADKATVRAYDEDGNRFSRGASGLLAHIFQHEMDHLNGVLYTDKAKELYDETDEPGHE